jgi:hypothetical protein
MQTEIGDVVKHDVLDPDHWSRYAERVRALAVGEARDQRNRLLALARMLDEVGKIAAGHRRPTPP